MSDLIFWYTGALVWACVGLVLALVVLVGGIVGGLWGYFHARRRANNWVALRLIHRAGTSLDDMQLLRNFVAMIGPPAGASYQTLNRWVALLGDAVAKQSATGSSPAVTTTEPGPDNAGVSDEHRKGDA